MTLEQLPLGPEMLETRSVMRSVNIDGQLIRIAERKGARGRVPLVLFNGIGANLEMFEPFLDQFDPDVPILTFDVPGTGGSPTAIVPYRFSGLARMVNKLCDHLGYGPVDVFGISWGGAAAQQFAWQFPQRCRRLILAATTAGAFMMPAHPKVLLKMASPLRYISPGHMRKIAATIYGGDFRSNPALAAKFSSLVRSVGPVGYFMQLFAGMGWTSIHWLWRLKQPTLVMAGTDDPIVPLINAKLIAKLIPKSRLITYNCGHLFLFTRMAEAAAEMGAFLRAEGEHPHRYLRGLGRAERDESNRAS